MSNSTTDPSDLAYPIIIRHNDNSFEIHTGLTKREIFAAMAMQGYCSSSAYSEEDVKYIANMSVSQADALIESLNIEEDE